MEGVSLIGSVEDGRGMAINIFVNNDKLENIPHAVYSYSFNLYLHYVLLCSAKWFVMNVSDSNL